MRKLIPAAVLLTHIACGGGGKSSAPTAPTTPTTPAAPTVTSLTVTGSGCAGGVCPGQVGNNLQLTATVQLSDSTTQNVTSTAQWSSSNTTVATVSASGLVTFRAAGDADVLAIYQGKLAGLTVRLIPAGPKTAFGTGQYLVGKDIAAGRYYTDPNSGCYWERESGLGGTLNEIIANDFVGYNAAQIIVDIKSSDLAFKTDADCGTWTQTPRGGVMTSIAPGMWLVNSQVTPGTYRANAASGCYWERLRHFEGVLSGIIANNFVASAGQQLVTIAAGDVGFNTDADCGTWTRVSFAGTDRAPDGTEAPQGIEANWRAHRAARR